ncbi:hypothetical protein BAE44_0023677, partial [Dichanthelium oligosanthes]
LPTDVLYEVLLRLPAIVLCRLRLVCRWWRSLTSDPDFAKAHTFRHPLVAGISLKRRRREVHIIDLSGNVVRRLPIARSVYDLNTHLDLICVSAEWGWCSSYILTAVPVKSPPCLMAVVWEIDPRPNIYSAMSSKVRDE